MQDNSLLVISVCGLAVVCVGLLAIVGFLVLRFTGHTVREFLGGGNVSGVVDSLSGADDREDSLSRRRRAARRPSTSDLRSRAESLDFNAAVQRHRTGESGPSAQGAPRPNVPLPPRQPASPFEGQPAEDTSSRRRRRRSTRDDEEIDDMLGGFLDDGDGDLDLF
jgi:hypothetical protein